MVEQEAVNFEVASSSLAGGAKNKKRMPGGHCFFILLTTPRPSRELALASSSRQEPKKKENLGRAFFFRGDAAREGAKRPTTGRGQVLFHRVSIARIFNKDLNILS